MKKLALILTLLTLCACAPDQPPEPVEPSPVVSAPTGEPATPSIPDISSEPTSPAVPGKGIDFGDPEPPAFVNASVHDPSIFRAHDGMFYVIGSHMASAKSEDLMRWTQVSTGPQKSNKLVDDPQAEFAEALEYARTTTFWAGDIHAMPDGRYFMYYCVCVGDSPLGAIGLAIADDPEGPYKDQGMFVKSGSFPPEGGAYDARVHPNAIDPQVFFDNDGTFWMVYGSYSGGIFILRMDPETGLPFAGQENFGYGKKLMGGNHSRLEGAYILYSPHSKYYYLFITFGGLDTMGGYNIRVARSEKPDGPYEDALGQNMINCKGPYNSFFDDNAIAPYGVKLMGGYQFRREEGEPGRTTGYLSPGHNSAYYDAETERYFIIFHTRFTNSGESHEIRVHEFFINEDGWLVVAPFRYDGGGARTFTPEQLTGSWKLIDHERDISNKAKISKSAQFLPDGSVVGELEGSWELDGDGKTARITINGTRFTGVFLRCWDNDHKLWTQAFTALSADGTALWGAGYAPE